VIIIPLREVETAKKERISICPITLKKASDISDTGALVSLLANTSPWVIFFFRFQNCQKGGRTISVKRLPKRITATAHAIFS